MPKLLCVTGLPRSGSTLICQLLAEHPHIQSEGMSSPIFGALQALRSNLTENEFLLSQLDGDFARVYTRVQRSCRAFASAWWNETEKPIVLDKHRGWLNQIDLAIDLDADVQMVVCVRELGQIFGSIESQHQKTIWLDFPDKMANLSPYARADKLFGVSGVIGGPLRSLQAVQDYPHELQKRLFFVVFEHLMSDPVQVMKDLFDWLGIMTFEIDPNKLTVRTHEADSYYRFKYSHNIQKEIIPPEKHFISPRIQSDLRSNFEWFYELFYPSH